MDRRPAAADEGWVRTRVPLMAPAPDLRVVTRAVEDALYVSVGTGVLAFQAVQVRRRELRARLTGALDGIEAHLPGPARELFDRARAGD